MVIIIFLIFDVFTRIIIMLRKSKI